MDVVVSPAAHAAALWAGLILLLMLVLAVLTTRQRQRHNVLIGDGGIDELVRAVRAFGNATEYAPAGIAALGLLALTGANALLVHGVGALLLLGRLAHAWGLSRNVGVSVGCCLVAVYLGALLARGVISATRG